MIKYHAPVWNEKIIMEMGHKGERGIAIPSIEEDIQKSTEDSEVYIPTKMNRESLPKLPEISQPHILRHYLRLSQQTLGMALNIDLGMGTCTMKHSPLINEESVNRCWDCCSANRGTTNLLGSSTTPPFLWSVWLPIPKT